MVVIGVSAGGAAAHNYNYDRNRSERSELDINETQSNFTDTQHSPGFSGGSPTSKRGVPSVQKRMSGNSVSMDDWNKILRHAGLEPDVEEPEIHWTSSQCWNGVLAVMIGINAIVIGLETDFNREVEGHVAWSVIEYAFLLFWIFDIGARIANERWEYVHTLWNALDVFLVLLNLFEVLVMPLAFDEKVGIVRVLRILRILRLLRLVKAVPYCKELWLIILGFVEALRTLGWVLLLLFIVVYAGAIVMTNVVGHQCDDKYLVWSECDDIFGSVFASMFSLFQVITMESWSMNIARHVLKKNPWLFVFFLTFLMLTTFGLLNIIVGVIVENTLRTSNDEQAKHEQHRMRKMFDEMLEMRCVFEDADEDGSGVLDMEEFSAILKKGDVREKLRKFDIPYDHPNQLFEMLDQDEGGTLTIFEFIDGIARLRSQPKPSDMRTACQQAMNTTAQLDKIETNFAQFVAGGGVMPGPPFGSVLQELAEAEYRQHGKKKKTRLNTDSPAWGSEENSSPAIEEGPRTPEEHHRAVMTPPLSPDCGLLDAPRGNTKIILPGIDNRDLRPLESNGADRDVQILESQLLAWEPEGVQIAECRDVRRPVSYEDLESLVQNSMPRVATPKEKLDEASVASEHGLLKHLQDVEQTFDKRLGSLEQTARNLAKSQIQLQKELDEMLRRRCSC